MAELNDPVNSDGGDAKNANRSEPAARLSRRALCKRLSIALIGIAAAGGWFLLRRDRAQKMDRARRRRPAETAIRELGGFIGYAPDDDLAGRLRRFFGAPQSQRFSIVVAVDLEGTPAGDEDLQWLLHFPQLQALGLTGTRVGDDGLKSIEPLVHLEILQLGQTGVTDAGLVHLEGLVNLEELILNGTRVTDAGLERVGDLTNLRTLDLSQTAVSDAGLGHLKRLTALERLNLQGTAVSTEGLQQLRTLTRLRVVPPQQRPFGELR